MSLQQHVTVTPTRSRVRPQFLTSRPNLSRTWSALRKCPRGCLLLTSPISSTILLQQLPSLFPTTTNNLEFLRLFQAGHLVPPKHWGWGSDRIGFNFLFLLHFLSIAIAMIEFQKKVQNTNTLVIQIGSLKMLELRCRLLLFHCCLLLLNLQFPIMLMVF